MKRFTSITIALKIWLLSSVTMAVGFLIWFIFSGSIIGIFYSFLVLMVALIFSLPVFFAFSFCLPVIKKIGIFKNKIVYTFLLAFAIALLYGFVGAIIDTPFQWVNNNSISTYFLQSFGMYALVVFGCLATAILLSLSPLKIFFNQQPVCNINESWQADNHHQIKQYMENLNEQNMPQQSYNYVQKEKNNSNSILIKAIITGVLILVMLIPTFYVQSLVSEREQRQKEVVSEVTNKWSKQQTFTAPYIYITYQNQENNDTGKPITVKRDLIFLPENLKVDGNIAAEERPRSIYKVLLYKTDVNAAGNFQLKLPSDISVNQLNFSDAKICLGVTDFKGVEEKMVVKFNNKDYELESGLPTSQIDSNGLSSNIALSMQDFEKPIEFSVKAKLKGSEQLKFVPLSANSSFNLKSTWSNPSFDGNVLPTSRTVDEKGFQANWIFNKANLPFNTNIKQSSFNKNNFAFGITMVQPADQYVKTMRSVKYAILFIGLTFALFFIIELMQSKPFHPVQYVLVGLGLIIFFTLLLSMSEFILFDYAYIIAAIATILLITLYAKSHFKSFKTASVFASVLTALYGFIFILIRLEDTALLVGSIGLFIVLALIMYASRKINWYQPALKHPNNEA